MEFPTEAAYPFPRDTTASLITEIQRQFSGMASRDDEEGYEINITDANDSIEVTRTNIYEVTSRKHRQEAQKYQKLHQSRKRGVISWTNPSEVPLSPHVDTMFENVTTVQMIPMLLMDPPSTRSVDELSSREQLLSPGSNSLMMDLSDLEDGLDHEIDTVKSWLIKVKNERDTYRHSNRTLQKSLSEMVSMKDNLEIQHRDALDAILAASKEEKNTLIEELKQSNESKRKLKKIVAEMIDEKNKMDDLLKENEELHNKIHYLEDALVKANVNSSLDTEKKLDELRRQHYSQLTSAISDVEAKFAADLECMTREKEREIEREKNSHNLVTKALEEEVKYVRAELDAVNKNFSEFVEEHATSSDTNSEVLREELDDIQMKLEQEQENHKKAMDEFQKNLNYERQRFQVLLSEISSIESQLHSKNVELTRVNKKLSECQDNHTKECDRMQFNLSKMCSLIELSSADRDHAKEEAKRLKMEVDMLHEARRQFNRYDLENKAEIARLKKKLESSTQEMVQECANSKSIGSQVDSEILAIKQDVNETSNEIIDCARKMMPEGVDAVPLAKAEVIAPAKALTQTDAISEDHPSVSQDLFLNFNLEALVKEQDGVLAEIERSTCSAVTNEVMPSLSQVATILNVIESFIRAAPLQSQSDKHNHNGAVDAGTSRAIEETLTLKKKLETLQKERDELAAQVKKLRHPIENNEEISSTQQVLMIIDAVESFVSSADDIMQLKAQLSSVESVRDELQKELQFMKHESARDRSESAMLNAVQHVPFSDNLATLEEKSDETTPNLMAVELSLNSMNKDLVIIEEMMKPLQEQQYILDTSEQEYAQYALIQLKKTADLECKIEHLKSKWKKLVPDVKALDLSLKNDENNEMISIFEEKIARIVSEMTAVKGHLEQELTEMKAKLESFDAVERERDQLALELATIKAAVETPDDKSAAIKLCEELQNLKLEHCVEVKLLKKEHAATKTKVKLLKLELQKVDEDKREMFKAFELERVSNNELEHSMEEMNNLIEREKTSSGAEIAMYRNKIDNIKSKFTELKKRRMPVDAAFKACRKMLDQLEVHNVMIDQEKINSGGSARKCDSTKAAMMNHESDFQCLERIKRKSMPLLALVNIEHDVESIPNMADAKVGVDGDDQHDEEEMIPENEGQPDKLEDQCINETSESSSHIIFEETDSYVSDARELDKSKTLIDSKTYDENNLINTSRFIKLFLHSSEEHIEMERILRAKQIKMETLKEELSRVMKLSDENHLLSKLKSQLEQLQKAQADSIEAFSCKSIEYETQIAKVHTILEGKNDENETLKLELQDAKSLLNELESQLEIYVKEDSKTIDNLQEKLREEKTLRETTLVQIEQQKVETNVLQGKLDESQSQLNTLKYDQDQQIRQAVENALSVKERYDKELKVYYHEIKNLKKQIEILEIDAKKTIKSEVDHIKIEFIEVIQALEKNIDEDSKTIESLCNKLRDEHCLRESTQVELERKEAKIDELQKKLEFSSSQVETLTHDGSQQLKQALENSYTMQDNYEKELNAYLLEIDTLKQQIETVQIDVRQQCALDVDQLKIEFDDAIKENERKICDSNLTIENIQQQLKDEKHLREITLAKLETRNMEMDELQDKLEDSKSHIKTLENNHHRQLKQVLDDAQFEQQRLENKMSDYCQEIDNLKKQIETAESDAKQKIKSEVDHLKVEFNEVIQAFEKELFDTCQNNANLISEKVAENESFKRELKESKDKISFLEIQLVEFKSKNIEISEQLNKKMLLENELVQVRKQLASAIEVQNVLSLLRDEHESLTRSYDAINQQKNDLTKSLEEAEVYKHEATAKLHETQLSLDKNIKEYNDIIAKHQSLQNEHQMIKHDLSQKQKLVSTLSNEKETLIDQVDKYAKELKNLFMEKASLDLECRRYKEDKERIASYCDELKRDHQTELRSLQAELEEQSAAMKKDIKTLTCQITSIESIREESRKIYEKDIELQQTEFDELKSKYREAVTDLDSLTDLVSSLKEALADEKNNCQILQSQFKGSESERRATLLQNTELMVQLTAKKASEEVMQEQIHNLNRQLTEIPCLNSKLTDMMKSESLMKEHIKFMESQVVELNKLREEVSRAADSEAQLRDHINSLETQAKNYHIDHRNVALRLEEENSKLRILLQECKEKLKKVSDDHEKLLHDSTESTVNLKNMLNEAICSRANTDASLQETLQLMEQQKRTDIKRKSEISKLEQTIEILKSKERYLESYVSSLKNQLHRGSK